MACLLQLETMGQALQYIGLTYQMCRFDDGASPAQRESLSLGIDQRQYPPQVMPMERMKAILVVTAALAFTLSPMMSGGFAGFRPDQFPIPQVDPPVQPAGYAFAIWGVIYLWLLAGAVFGLVKRAETPGWDATRWPLIISLVVGAAWIPVAQMSPFWAAVLIWGMLVTALWALLSAGASDRLWLRTPIALYAGWLTAASCVALGLMLAGHGVVDARLAALAMIVLALVIALVIMTLRGDTPEYAGAVIWALAGVVVANLGTANWAVLMLCAAGIAALGVSAWQAHAGLSRAEGLNRPDKR
jgi:MFS family permease